MNLASSDIAAPSWRIKRLNQSGKTYVQVVIQPDRSSPRFTVGLGYLGVEGLVTYDGMSASHFVLSSAWSP